MCSEDAAKRRANGQNACQETAPARKRTRRGSVPLSEAHPDLEAEWDYARNGDLLPSEVSSGSSKKVWWVCSTCGYSWEAYINNRANKGSGCPACAGRVPRKGQNDVATLYPNLMLDWDWEVNGALDPGTLMRTNSVRVFWKCHVCGNQWASSLVTRTLHDTGCPVCRERERAEKGNLLVVRYPDVAAEWDFAKNVGIDIMSVAQYSDLSVWWRCRECGNEYKTRVRNRTNGHTGCPQCAARKSARKVTKTFVEQGFPVRVGITFDAASNTVFSGLGRCGCIRVYEPDVPCETASMGLAGENLPKPTQVPPFHFAKEIDTSGMKREGIMHVLKANHITHFITGELGGNAMHSLATTGTLCFYDVQGDAEKCIAQLAAGTLKGKRLERARTLSAQ